LKLNLMATAPLGGAELEGALPLALPLALLLPPAGAVAVALGPMNSVTPSLGITGSADADAPIPTRPFWPSPTVPAFVAALWKAAKLFGPGWTLMAPTMPAVQCGIGMSCWQKNQIGAEAFVIVSSHVDSALPVGGDVRTSTQPEPKPPAIGWHGELKEDCVTLWFPGIPLNKKVITEPFVAVIVVGENW